MKKLSDGSVEVSAGVIPARLMKGPADWQAVEEGCYYDEPSADHAVQFFEEFLVHSKGQWAGQTFKLLEWQEWEIIRPLFGWLREDGTRRFRRAYIEVPKKNGKSTISAGIALYLTKADGEEGAEVYSAAADHDQAAIVYREAANMVRKSEALAETMVVKDSVKTILDPGTGSFYKALSADAPTKEGLNIHGLIFDELHAQKTRVLWDTLKYGGASRRQPLFVSITTAGTDRLSICYDQHKYARGIMAGTVRDTSFYAFIAAADDNDDWEDPKVWAKANPSFGVTLSKDQFMSDYLEAKANPASQNSFRRYRLNQWTEQDIRWLDMTLWRSNPSKPPVLPPRSWFIGGLDLASTQDIAAYVQLYYEKQFYVKCHFFIPEGRMRERVKRDHVPYDLWQRQGLITATRGDVIDEEAIIETILKSAKTDRCKEIAYDPWNAPHIVTRLADEGMEMVPIRQGFVSLNYPSKELEKLVVARRLNHGGNPVLEWMARNVAVETDAAGNIKPSKKKSQEKIDGIVATVMALSRYLVHSSPTSRYESRGLVTL